MIIQTALPLGWEWSTIEQVADDKKYAIVDGPFGSNLKTSDYVDDGIPVLQGKNITNNQFRWIDIRFISKAKAHELSRSSVHEGDIIIVKIGSIGYSAELTNLEGYPFAIIPANLAKVSLNHQKANKKYVLHWLASSSVKNHLLSVASKTAQPALSLSKIKSLPIPLPPLAEQKRIAAILDKADAIRQKRQQAITLADRFLRSVFLDMFGDPVTNPKKLPKAPITEFTDIITGYAFKSDEYINDSDECVRLCRGTNTLTGYFDWSDTAFISKEKIKNLDNYLINEGDIILAMDRPWISSGLKVCLFPPNERQTYLVQRVARLRPKSFIVSHYLYSCIKSRAFEKHCRPTETTIPHISPIELKNFEVIVPKNELLNKYHTIATELNKSILKMLDKQKENENFFSSISQKAFSGQL